VLPPADEDLEDIPAPVRAVREDPQVRAELAELFRRNSPGPGDDRQRAAESWAKEALARLFHPDCFRTADVGPLRLHLEVASDVYPGPSRIHASAWDDDAEVWRPVGEVVLPHPPAGGLPPR
jgi:hypothetical protein